uniref:Uncharacterized protein n=1 Tax=Knipowitschia caucasica TaxID=637954 RepID=A0AAV2JR36_KNICA
MQLEFGSFQIGWLAVGRWWAKLRPHLLQNKVILWITLDKKPVWLSTIAVDVTPQNGFFRGFFWSWCSFR